MARLTGTCCECEGEFTFSSSDDLATLDCPHCGETAAHRCGLCNEYVSPELESHEECDASERQREARDRRAMAFEQWCDDEGDRMREEMR